MTQNNNTEKSEKQDLTEKVYAGNTVTKTRHQNT